MRRQLLKMAAAIALFACVVPNVQAQQCGAGTYRSFAAINGQSPSQTAVNNNNIYVGAARLQVSHQTFGNGTINTNDISANHYAGEPGIRIGNANTTTTTFNNRIETTLNFRNPQNMAQFLPVANLSFRLHDVDAGDNVIVDAYDQNGTLINLTTAIYSFDGSSGTPYVSYAGGNRFTSAGSDDAGNNTRLGTVNLNFAGLQVRQIVFRYYDPTMSGTYTIAEMFGCNVPVTVYKTTNPIAGGAFGFTLTNTTRNTGATVTTSAAGTPTQVDGSTATGTQPFTVTTPGTAVTINESSLPAGWALVDATCSNAAGTSVGSRSGNTYTIPAANTASGEALTCTFTNSRTTLRLQKQLPGGRAQAGDQFTLAIAGPGAPAAVTTTGSGSTATGTVTHASATAGSAYTLSETAAGSTVLSNYTTTYSCTNARAGGQTPSGSGTSFSVTPVAGDDLTCSFTNTRRTRLTLAKVVVNDDNGTQLPSAWTLSASGPTPISGTTGSAAVTNAFVTPGTYTLSESATPGGYTASAYSCVVNGGAPVSGNSIALAQGDAAVCTITNDDIGEAPPQGVACGIGHHVGPSGASFSFGAGGVNASATLQNMSYQAGSTALGSVVRFRDSTGRTYSTPQGSGRWLLTNSTTATSVTITFSPAIPAHRIGVGIYDMGNWDATRPNNDEDANYRPRLTLGLAGGASTDDFVGHQIEANRTQAIYTPGNGRVEMDASVFATGVERTWRQSVFLRGNSNALVSSLTLTATDVRPGDNIAVGLVSIPSCVTISKITEGGVGSFDFTSTNINNWNNTSAASPVTLTTTATGTPVSSTRYHYAHPVSSANQGTQPVTLTEAVPADWILAPAQCTDANSARNGNTGSFGTLAGGVLTIPADRMRFESNITCTFTNTRAAILRLQKALPDGRFVAEDQFMLSMTGAGAPAAVTTTGTGTTVTGSVAHTTAMPGSAYTLSEAAAGGANLGNYVTTYSCTNARPGGQTPSGSGTSIGITPVSADDLTCTFSNALRLANLSVTKTNTPAAGPSDEVGDVVISGSQTTYAIVVRNNGPEPVAGAILRDTPEAGLSACALATQACEVTGGTATCPTVGAGTGQLSMTNLQATPPAGGVLIPNIANGGEITVRVSCTVN